MDEIEKKKGCYEKFSITINLFSRKWKETIKMKEEKGE